MTFKERMVNIMLNRPVDRGIFINNGFWPETLERWKSEGMPPDYDFGFDPTNEIRLDVKTGYWPPFENEVIEDEGSTQIIRDTYGIIKRVKKDGTSFPQFISFPVKDRISWEKMKSGLNPDIPERFPHNWSEKVNRAKTDPDSYVMFYPEESHLSGFFSPLRELCGDNIYYMFYDEPGLVKDMVEFQEYRIKALIKNISNDLQIDHHHFWEDMCFKNGPLIGPHLFREFLLDPLQRTIEASKQLGVKIISVDSDGNVDQLIPLWIEAGVNFLEPMEVASGMDVVKIKKQYKDKLIIAGGIDKRAVAAGYDAIDKEIERVRPAYEIGGYIPCLDHSAPPDISWDNYRYYLDKIAKLVGK